MVGVRRAVLLLLPLLALAAACAAPEDVEPPEARYLRAQGRYEEARALAERYRQEAEAARLAITATRAEAQRRALATREAVEILATRQALEERATRAALEIQATAAAQAAAMRATEDARAVRATATAVALRATATAVARAAEAEARALWWEERFGRPVRTLAAGLLLLGGLALAGWAAVRVLDALILRIRVIRDPAGFPILVPEPDGQGRQVIFLPHRAPGPALTASPPDAAPPRVEAPAADPDATRRAQAVELIRAVAAGGWREAAGAVRRMEAPAARPAVEVIPPDRVPPEIREWIRDAQARALAEDQP